MFLIFPILNSLTTQIFPIPTCRPAISLILKCFLQYLKMQC